jgi:hypothetical protein
VNAPSGSSRPLVRPAAVRIGVLATIAATLVMALIVVQHGRQSVFRNDAEFFWLVARDPFSNGAVFRPFAHEMGNAYRYGRILFPLLAWVLVGGRASLVQWSLMAVDVVAFGVATALACELAARRTGDARTGLVVLLTPAMWFSLVLAVSEPFVLALVLGVYLLHLDGRLGASVVAAAACLLTREAAVVALVPAAVRDIRARGVRAAVGWAAVPVPLVAWWAIVRVRVGEWPFLDPSISRREALAAPLSGVVTVIREGADASHWLAFVLGAITVAAAIHVHRTRRWFPVTHGAVAFAAVILLLGPNAWRYPGEAIRLLGPAQFLTLLAVGLPAAIRGRSPAGGANLGPARHT